MAAAERKAKEKQKVIRPAGKILIFADDREAVTLAALELERLGAIVQSKRLEVADFILSERVGVEKKTAADFIQSIIDGRLFEQMSALVENFARPILIIEGDLWAAVSERRVHLNAIRGALGSIAIDYRVPILWAADHEETAALLFAIARREQLVEKREPAIRGKRAALSFAQQQEFLIAGLPHVSTKLARRLLEKFKTPAKVFAANERQLQKVEGIGKEKARRIREMLENKYATEKQA